MRVARRLLALLAAPLLAALPAALHSLALQGLSTSDPLEFLLFLVFVARFGIAAALLVGVPILLLLVYLRRFSFWSVLALGAFLGLLVAVWIHFTIVPASAFFVFLLCVLPGAAAAGVAWFIGGWSPNNSFQRTSGLRPLAAELMSR